MSKTPTGETTKTEPAGTTRRKEALKEIEACVCRDRQNTYGDAEDNFRDIADYMTLWLRQRGLLNDGARRQSFDVAQLSSFIKIARKAANPRYRDNWIDDAGYNVCGAGIVVGQEPVYASIFEGATRQWTPTVPSIPNPIGREPGSYQEALADYFKQPKP